MPLSGSLVIKYFRTGLCGLALALSISATPQPAEAVSVTFPGTAYLQGIVTVTYPSNAASVNVVNSIVGFAQMAAAMSQPNWHRLFFAFYRLAHGSASPVGDGSGNVSVPLVPLIWAQVQTQQTDTGPASNGIERVFSLGGLSETDEPFDLRLEAPEVQGIALTSGAEATDSYLLLWQLTEQASEDSDEPDQGDGASGPVVAAIPAPSAQVLLLSGLIGLIGLSRFRRGPALRPTSERSYPANSGGLRKGQLLRRM